MAVVKAQASITLALVNDGATGAAGAAGKDGVGIKSSAVTYAAGTNGTTAPTGTYSTKVPSVAAGGYLWTKTVLTYTNGTTATSYSVGHIGKDGATGKDGVAGKDGVGIKSTVIEYAVSSNGVAKPTTGWSATIPSIAPGQFLWTRTTWSYTDGTNEVGYSVAKAGAIGPKGERGKQIFKSKYEGTPNQAGRYWSDLSPAPSVDNPPKIGDTVITPAGNIFQINAVTVGGGGGGSFGVGDVLGNIKGDTGKDGLPGKDGVGITATTITYASSTSGTTAPTGGFSATIPAVSAGSYLWTKTVWTYSDGTNETGYSVALMGKTGATGKQGATGATGPAGPPGPAGKDITSFSKGTSVPTMVAAAGSMYWLLDSTGACSTVYISDGSKWNATQVSASLIRAASFQGMSFEGVTFTGSEFNTTYTNVANTVGDSGTKFTGTGKFAGPELVFDSMTDDTTPQAVRTAVAPEGFSAYAGSKAFGYFSAFGQMSLGDANGNSGSLTAEMLQQMDNVGALLWSGAWGMMATTTCTPSKAISKCMRGWAILWSYGTTNAARNTDYNITYVPKWFATGHSGAGWITVLHNNTGGHDTQKYVYITDTTIKGNGNNGKEGQNADFVMREVREW